MTSPVQAPALAPAAPVAGGVDSGAAWFRLGVALLLMTIGNCGMWVVAVVLPTVQADFGVGRAQASLPYTLMMIGFGLGGVFMGRAADRLGLFRPLLLAALCTGTGFVLASRSTDMLGFALAHGLFIGLLGSSLTFAPLMADIALWFTRRRGIAVAVCASGNYLAGTVWPPLIQHFVETAGWRSAYLGLGLFCGFSMAALAPLMRRRSPVQLAVAAPVAGRPDAAQRPFGLSPNAATAALCVAGVACCCLLYT
ncbi:MAG: MFS transporter, partial [Rhodoferax sp.]|nr:MFS transporter [Rhodoferax sp.]